MSRQSSIVGGLVAVLVGVTACGVRSSPPPADVAGPVREEYRTIAETVWQRVHDTYFDSTFGGVDWNDVRRRHLPHLARAANDEAFSYRLNEMLYELGVSHLGVYRPDFLLDAVASPYDYGPGSVGIDIRLLEGEAIITWVRAGSSAQRAGLGPGFVLLTIDGITVDALAGGTYLTPPDNERNRRRLVTQEILRHVYGPPGSAVSVGYADDAGQRHEKRLERTARGGRHMLYDGGPPVFAEVTARRLDHGIGYLRVPSFLGAVSDDVRAAIETMRSAPGLIIDLRGNTGGDFDLFIGKLVRQPASCLSVRTRAGTADFTIEPENDAYAGPVVLLVDEMSVSAAELFAACLKGIGRAVVIGQPTPGVALGTNLEMLPDGAVFVYPNRQYIEMDGRVIEGEGVFPDVAVDLERAQLLRGSDSQLDAAISYLETTFQ